MTVYVTKSSISPDTALLYLTPEMRYFGVWTLGRESFDVAYPGAVESAQLLEIATNRLRRFQALAEIANMSQEAGEC